MRIQFGVGRLMILTTAVAIILAISIRSQAPMLSKWILVSYFACIAVWMVIRGPNVIAGLIEVSRKRTEIKKRRAEIEREIMERKEKK